MKRLAFTFTVFLLLGAIVNVAVAWGIVAFQVTNSIAAPTSPRKPMRLRDSPVDELDGVGLYINRMGCKVALNLVKTEASFRVVELSEVGWPVITLLGQSHQTIDFVSAPPRQSFTTECAIRFRTPTPGTFVLGPTVLPTKPALAGFAINTIFYAAVLWVMFVLPFAFRRRLRIRRGLCPACAYPIGSSPVCTECGASLPLPREGEGRGEGA